MNPQFLAVMNSNLVYTEEVFETITYTHDYWIFLCPLMMSVADVITGWIQATINENWISTKMRYGIMRKAMMFLIIILAYSFEYAIEAVHQIHLANWVSGYVIIMESLSILENLNQAGVPIPDWVRRKLGKLKERMEGEENEENKEI